MSGCPLEEAPPPEGSAESTGCVELAQVQGRAGGQIRSLAEGVGGFSDYDIGRSTVTAKVASPCSTAIATRLQESACAYCARNGSDCEALVRSIFEMPPPGCSPCGDGTCAGDETAASCPQDCTASCGDSMCEDTESELSCPLDCAQPCGDGVCAGNEDPEVCPEDCTFAVGDGLCSMGENPGNSPADCGGQTLGQPCEGDDDCNGGICPADTNRCTCNTAAGGVCATSTCGDGFCQSYENAFACPGDCCQPEACQDVQRAGCVGQDRVVCVEQGEGNCPQIMELESCEFGCRNGECVACPNMGAIEECDARGFTCNPDGHIMTLCEPFPGIPSCLVTEQIDCRRVVGVDNTFTEPTCTPVGCNVGCPEQCTPNLRLCAGGTVSEICRANIDGTQCNGFEQVPCLGLARCDHSGMNGDCFDPLAPTLNGPSPNQGAVGTEVTLRGLGFGEAQGQVTFYQEVTAPIVTWADRALIVTVPEGATTGPITVTLPNGSVAQWTNFIVR